MPAQTVRAILAANDRGGYTVPNNRVYPFQWNWDSAFVAMGFALLDEDRAFTELERLFEAQWPDGMVPHIVFHVDAEGYYPGPEHWGTPATAPRSSGITQPPVAASAAWRIVEAARDRVAAEARARALLPKLFASHAWWHEVRDPDGSGLVRVVNPWETGRDNSPEWDAPLAAVVPTVSVGHLRQDNKRVDPKERPTDDFYNRVMTLVTAARATGWDNRRIAVESAFRVCDIGIQSILIRADRDLAALARALAEPGMAARLEAWADRSAAALAGLVAPDGSWRSKDLVSGRLADASVSAGFLPLYARAASQAEADAAAARFRAWAGRVARMVPSTDPGDPRFDPHRYWRGPVWSVVNFMIADGFAHYGHDDIAARIRRDTGQLTTRHGFAEYFDPVTGAPLGGRDFSWTAAIALLWNLVGVDQPVGGESDPPAA
ncbi:MGH1-like glycoside hydrolase domain-containing protein [Prosthecomicrobium sp. N25]|uniref:MGH1-like glycoside hydrolase domain-containing protein n=1 Tax=Prosthecomicrobium sp. N25 TaxID=3129254 RepID=UPI0030768865